MGSAGRRREGISWVDVQHLDLGGGHIGVCVPSNSLGRTLTVRALHRVSVFTLCE